ncbi:MAG: class I SAM-dependent methyltransferase [Rhodospirillales bacterium]|nr:class I SAM-dependent methyltransferase [Rhodospirillales bacterium]
MVKSDEKNQRQRHLRINEPSPWVRRFASLVPQNGPILDLACGNGRHARYFLSQGYRVVAVDRNVEPIDDLVGNSDTEIIGVELEDGSEWPLAGRTFAGVVVVNYLHRPLFPHLLDAVAEDGVFIYETFARGNEKYCRPRNPDHLLMGGELIELVGKRFHIVCYEQGLVERGPLPGVIQRICAVNGELGPYLVDPSSN